MYDKHSPPYRLVAINLPFAGFTAAADHDSGAVVEVLDQLAYCSATGKLSLMADWRPVDQFEASGALILQSFFWALLREAVGDAQSAAWAHCPNLMT